VLRPNRSSSACGPGSTEFRGARLFLQAQQDLHIGGRQTAAEYQYTLSGDDAGAIYSLVPKLIRELAKHPDQLTDVNTDMQQNGLQTYVTIDRATAARYGLGANQVRCRALRCVRQRTVSTIYNPYNQYFVVMEVAPKYWQQPQDLNRIFLSTAAGNVTGRSRRRCCRHGIGVKPFAAVAPRVASSNANALNANAQGTYNQRDIEQAGAERRAAAPTARPPKPWCRCPPWPGRQTTTRRSRSTIRAA